MLQRVRGSAVVVARAAIALDTESVESVHRAFVRNAFSILIEKKMQHMFTDFVLLFMTFHTLEYDVPLRAST
jgi:hypothetical protein